MNILFFLKPKIEVAYIYDDCTLRQVLETMEYHKYASIPMLNREGEFVGTITEGDLLWGIKDYKDLNIKEAEGIFIRDFPRKAKFDVVAADADMEDLVKKAMNQNFVPVVDDQNKFIGIITRKSIIEYCYDKLNECDKYYIGGCIMIDFHTHIFPDKIAGKTLEFLSSRCGITPFTDGTAEGLRESGKRSGMDLSLALPVVTNPAQFQSINRFAAQFLEGDIISFGGIHPQSPDYKAELQELKRIGFKGIKIHPAYQETMFNDIRYKRIVSYASELDFIITVHGGYDPGYPGCIYCTPQMAAEVIDEVRPEKMVVAHMGGFKCWDDVERLIVGKPVYLDTAVVFGEIEDAQFVRIVRGHGIDKILFATDSPWSGQKESAEYLKKLPFSEDEVMKILDGNGRKLLTL